MISGLETPVVLIVFNRPATTQLVFDAISRVQPKQLLIVADGPRPQKDGEAEACRQVREIVSQVDWPCEVRENIADHNLGCKERIISGLNWVFSHVEEAIILEDDCLPDLSFFHFCQELLSKYRGDSRISYICGANLVQSYKRLVDSYFFSQIGAIWGWATWREEWHRYDRYLSDWPALRQERRLSEVFDQHEAIEHWTHIFDLMYEDRGPNTWDFQWLYTNLKNNSLAIVPSVNLITNIGFGNGATHTVNEDPRFMLATSSMEFPLKHPISLIPLRSLDRYRVKDMLPPSVARRILNKIGWSAAHLRDKK
jgi:hypothetical protein